MPGQTIDTQLSSARLIIENVLADPEMLATFAKAKRDAAYFEAARALYLRAVDLNRGQNTEHAEKVGATNDLQAARQAADRLYMTHLEWARFAFGEDEDLARRLQLRGPRKRQQDAWENQRRDFYSELLGDANLVATLLDLGRDLAELEAGRAAVDAAIKLRETRQREEGDAYHSTDERDDVLTDLAEWRTETTKLARLLFADEPQKLEKLGIRVRSTSRRKRPPGPTPPPIPPTSSPAA